LRDRLGDLDHLLSSHRQVLHQDPPWYVGAQAVKDLFGAPVHLGEIHHANRANQTRLAVEKDVLPYAEVGDQGQFLVDRADAQLLGMLWVTRLDLGIAEPDGALVLLVHARQNLDQSGFAGPVFPHKSQDFTGVDLKIHVFQRPDAGETFGDVRHPQ